MTNSIGEVEDAGAIFVIGSNTTETHPVISYRISRAKQKGAALIVADPRRIELVDKADVFLQLLPGTNVALLNGLAHVIIKEGLVDKDFIKERTEGYKEVKMALEKYTPEYVSEITGVAAEDIEKAARLYAKADSAALLYTMGITQHTSGTDSVLAIANLAMLTGNLGKASAGVNPLRGQNNVQGACDMGALPNVITGYQPVADAGVRAKFSEDWGVELTDKPGLTVTEIMDGAYKGNIKGMLIMGENPALSDADISHVQAALKKLDFLVVQDIFLTETAELADVVLPACSFAEKEGTFVNTERRVQLIRRAVTPRGESRPDWAILRDLAGKLGFAWEYHAAGDIFAEIRRLTPSYAGITYRRLEAEGGLQWPCPAEDHPGTPFLHQGKFSRGLGKFHPVEYGDAAEQPDDAYPFILTTGRNLYHYHTGTMTRRSRGLDAIRPEEFVQLNEEDAGVLGVADGDRVKVSSRRGQVAVRVKVTEEVPKGVIFMTFHFKESPVNVLTNCALDPKAKTPELKVCAVNVEKAV